MNNLEIIQYQWLLRELVSRDLKIKYRKSVLGYLWSILNPLMMMIILTIVFSTIFKFDIPNYAVYLLAGQLLFGFFSESTTMAMSSIINGAALIKKVYLPKYIFPVSRVLSSFVTMVLSMMALFIVMIATDCSFSLTIMLIPVVLLYIFLFSIGIGLMLSVLVVYFRDVEYLYGVFLNAFMYLTPIIYPISIIPKEYRQFMILNPMYNFIEMFRNITLYCKWPTLTDHLLCSVYALAALVLGIWVFKNHQKNFILYI